jgi:hypothetical protein
MDVSLDEPLSSLLTQNVTWPDWSLELLWILEFGAWVFRPLGLSIL